jgi:hypothetical protein
MTTHNPNSFASALSSINDRLTVRSFLRSLKSLDDKAYSCVDDIVSNLKEKSGRERFMLKLIDTITTSGLGAAFGVLIYSVINHYLSNFSLQLFILGIELGWALMTVGILSRLIRKNDEDTQTTKNNLCSLLLFINALALAVVINYNPQGFLSYVTNPIYIGAMIGSFALLIGVPLCRYYYKKTHRLSDGDQVTSKSSSFFGNRSNASSSQINKDVPLPDKGNNDSQSSQTLNYDRAEGETGKLPLRRNIR